MTPKILGALCLFAGFLSFMLWPCQGASAAPSASTPPQTAALPAATMRIAIHCAQRVLQVWSDTELIAEYPIEIGKGGIHKKRGGDHKTPIGDYEISWMASRRSSSGHRIVEGRSWCRGNKFINATTGPALEKLWTDAYGGSEATVMSISYPNDREGRKGYTGECIHIHAVKRPRQGTLHKSYGCIHMFAQDAIELYEMVQVGTPCKILP